MPPIQILVTGGCVSGLGKGTLASSLGLLLRECGVRVAACKIDPYLNANAGTLAPAEHGECFVLGDGTECDLDLGCYQRFLDVELCRDHTVTGGQVWGCVLRREADGDFLGTSVQVVPHITDEILTRLRRAQGDADVLLVELGGTAGELEGLPFLEALRQLHTLHHVHVAWVPYLSKELKSKPAQQSIHTLMTHGLKPDVVALRAVAPAAALEAGLATVVEKIARATGVTCAWTLPQADCVWRVPFQLVEQGVLRQLSTWLGHPLPTPELEFLWPLLAPRARTVRVALVGKYARNADSYLSLTRALQHAAAHHAVALHLVDDARTADAVVVPGGFGERGLGVKMDAVACAHRRDVPFLGICLGLQLAVVRRVRDAHSLPHAHSVEFDPAADPAVTVPTPEEAKAAGRKSGTMRLGTYRTRLTGASMLCGLYQVDTIHERHRHRYEIHPGIVERARAAGLLVTGTTGDGHISVMEDPTRRFFVGVQFHPEFTASPRRAHPLFSGFVAAALEK